MGLWSVETCVCVTNYETDNVQNSLHEIEQSLKCNSYSLATTYVYVATLLNWLSFHVHRLDPAVQQYNQQPAADVQNQRSKHTTSICPILFWC